MNITKILIAVTLTTLLSSCFMQTEKTEEKMTGSGDTVLVAQSKPCTEVAPMDAAALDIWKAGSLPNATDDMVGSGDIVYVHYTLRSCNADGQMLDTSREADARAGEIYMSGRTYEPFPTKIGSHQTVRGFEYGLIGMKKGERKTIVVAPVDGYGGPQEEKVPKEVIAPEYTRTIDASFFQDTVKQTVKREILGEVGKNIKVGQTLTGGQNNDIPAKVIKVTPTEVTVEIDNRNHPFQGKPLTPGTSAEVDPGVTFTIKSLKGTGITFDVVNTNSPFVGKYTVGATAEIPRGTITIKSIDEDGVVLSMQEKQNDDPKKKTLFFDVEIVEIQ